MVKWHLSHRDKVLNQSVTQIVVPLNRRADIMSFARDNSFHQGHKKTSERRRFRYSFLAYFAFRRYSSCGYLRALYSQTSLGY
jgi:hypothetical protein